MDSARQTAIYCRISEDRIGAGLGVERQETDCRELAVALGLEVARVLVDNDISAYSGKPRPDYERLLAGIGRGEIQSVIVWHADRLHRSPAELERYIEASEKHGVPTHSVRGGDLDLSSASGRMTARIVGAVARHESEHKAERVQAWHVQAAKAGRYRGGSARPFGYEADGIAVRQDEAQLIREAYTEIIAGGALAEIISRWNASGVLTTGGRPWYYSGLRQLLLRHRNYGGSVHQGKVVGIGAWEPIVSEADYRTLAAVLSDPRRRKSSSNQGKHLMSGLLLCYCGSPMRVTHTKSGTNYTCSGTHFKSRRVEYVDAFVKGVVLLRMSQPDARPLLAAGVDTGALQRKAERWRQQDAEAKQLFDEGLLTAAEFKATRLAVRGKLAEIESQLAGETVPELAELAVTNDPAELWERWTWRQRRAVINVLMTVTALPIPPGSPRRFDPTFLDVEWK